MSDYRDESDFDWDYRTDTSDDDLVIPYKEEREQQRMRHPTSGVLLARMREALIRANTVIKQATDGAGEITSAANVQQILGELQGHERDQAMRLANAIGENAFEYFFTYLQELDQLVVQIYQKEQQLELSLYRPGGLGEPVAAGEQLSSVVQQQQQQ